MKLCRYTILIVSLMISVWASAAKPEKPGIKGNGGKKGSSLTTVRPKHWNETSVRKVLQTFTYGGFATDQQIALWAKMKPKTAVSEILTFNPVNEKLSPIVDATADHCHGLGVFQDFIGSDVPENPKRYDERYRYSLLGNGTTVRSDNLQRAWVQLINTRGCNPFLHKVAFYLSNYHAAISMHKVRGGLMADYYDIIVYNLINTGVMTDVLREAAGSAAVARAYGHQYNTYNNSSEKFYGNDDFAREFFQLFFRINGITENDVDPDYHELTTIEHNAWLLTGMRLDYDPVVYGSTSSSDWNSPVIDFTDHDNIYIDPNDGEEKTRFNINNFSRHYHSDLDLDSCLEILHTEICGENSVAKIAQLTEVAINHQESLDNIPVTIIDAFADDNLDESGKEALRGAWAAGGADLLVFLRNYAASELFHSDKRYKYVTAFDRNLQIHNANVLTNEEAFVRKQYYSPRSRMAAQGASVFEPAHDVFGGQTGLQAANNRYVFKNAYAANGSSAYFNYQYELIYPLDAEDPPNTRTWVKDWGDVIPANTEGDYLVSEVATWLWQRLLADGGKNFDMIARAQVQSLLATGLDFSYAVDSSNAHAVYGSEQIAGEVQVRAVFDQQAESFLDLATNTGNKRVGMAINFISMTPYIFATEGK